MPEVISQRNIYMYILESIGCRSIGLPSRIYKVCLQELLGYHQGLWNINQHKNSSMSIRSIKSSLFFVDFYSLYFRLPAVLLLIINFNIRSYLLWAEGLLLCITFHIHAESIQRGFCSSRVIIEKIHYGISLINLR